MRDDKLKKLYIENYSNTEFVYEQDVYEYLKDVSAFLRFYNERDRWKYKNPAYDTMGYLKMWEKHIQELIMELFNSFVYGNFLSVSAMTRTLMECYVYVSIMKKEQSQELLDEWWICNLIHKVSSAAHTEAGKKQIDNIKLYCELRNIDFEEKWNYYTKYAKKEHGWLRTLLGNQSIGFQALCKYIGEEDIYSDYESANAYVHGQDIATKLLSFTFYCTIYVRLYLMMQYIFKAIRLFETDKEIEDWMLELETGLIELGDTYLE